MASFLSDPKYDFISSDDKKFIIAFSEEMEKLNYTSGNEMHEGFCWGKYMLIYRKKNTKDKQGIARIYIREDGIVLRLYLNKVDRYRNYIEQAESFIQEPFIGTYGNCKHCHNEKDGHCKFRKTYTLHSHEINKCNGMTFEFFNPSLEKCSAYLELIKVFFIKNHYQKHYSA